MGEFQEYNLSHSEMFFNESFTSFHLGWVEGVDFGNLGDKVRMEFDGMVIGALRRELVMGFL